MKRKKESQEHDFFNHLMKMAKNDNKKPLNQNCDEYIKKGLSKGNARI